MEVSSGCSGLLLTVAYGEALHFDCNIHNDMMVAAVHSRGLHKISRAGIAERPLVTQLLQQ